MAKANIGSIYGMPVVIHDEATELDFGSLAVEEFEVNGPEYEDVHTLSGETYSKILGTPTTYTLKLSERSCDKDEKDTDKIKLLAKLLGVEDISDKGMEQIKEIIKIERTVDNL